MNFGETCLENVPSFAEILTNYIGQETVMCSALNGKKEYLKAEVGDEEKWDFLNFAEAWTPSDTMKGDTEDDKDGIFFSHVRKDFILYKVIYFYRRRRFCISLLVLYILIF